MAPEAEAQRCRDPLPTTFSPGSGGRLSPTEGTPAARGRDSVTVCHPRCPPLPAVPWHSLPGSGSRSSPLMLAEGPQAEMARGGRFPGTLTVVRSRSISFPWVLWM